MAELSVIYQDKDILAIEKPAGIICFPETDLQASEDSIAQQLIKQFPELHIPEMAPRFGIAHRLDKDTSGLLLIGKNISAFNRLQKMFEEHKIEKRYLALVSGNVVQNQGTIDTLIGRSPSDRTKQAAFLPIDPLAKKQGSRPAITDWKKIKNYPNFTLIEALPHTGRKHQIRVHFQFIGHPLAGDKIYGFKNQSLPGLERHFLHAHALKFEDQNGQVIEIKSDLAPDLKKVLENLEK